MGESQRLHDLYGQGDLAEAWRTYNELASLGRAGAAEHLVGALSAWKMRELWSAKLATEAAVAAGPEGDVLGKVRFTAGHVYREIGDLYLAREYYDALLAEWHLYPSLKPILLGAACHNLGLVYYQRREYGEAVLCCNRATEEFRREGMRDYLRQSLQNCAWALCCLNDAWGARESLSEAEELLDSPPARWHQDVGMAFLAFVEGEYAECQRITMAVVEQQQAPMDVMAQAAWLSGRSSLAQGYRDRAMFLARTAVDWATRAQDSRCMSDAHGLLKECYIQEKSVGA